MVDYKSFVPMNNGALVKFLEDGTEINGFAVSKQTEIPQRLAQIISIDEHSRQAKHVDVGDKILTLSHSQQYQKILIDGDEYQYISTNMILAKVKDEE